jgi:hypothetical protein
METSYDGVAAY